MINFKRGLLASLFLVSLYFGIMLLFTGSITAALDQFRRIWLLFILLITGFGLQFSLARLNRVTLANSGIASLSMIACCVHHLADFSLFLSFSGPGLFFSRYQTPLLVLGVIANWSVVLYYVKIR